MMIIINEGLYYTDTKTIKFPNSLWVEHDTYYHTYFYPLDNSHMSIILMGLIVVLQESQEIKLTDGTSVITNVSIYMERKMSRVYTAKKEPIVLTYVI